MAGRPASSRSCGGGLRARPSGSSLPPSAGVERGSLAAVHQVHGAAVVAAHVGTAERPRADGLVSRDPSILLTVRVADCAALLIADRRLGSVAAVHAGWRGTAAGIAGAAVARLRELYGSHPGDLVAALGPSIGPCCYTVGPELIDAFRRERPRRRGRRPLVPAGVIGCTWISGRRTAISSRPPGFALRQFS